MHTVLTDMSCYLLKGYSEMFLAFSDNFTVVNKSFQCGMD